MSSDLPTEAAALTRIVKQLNNDMGQQIVRLSLVAAKNRRIIWILACSLAFDIALTIAMGVGYVDVQHNARNIGAVADRLTVAQTVDKQKALCPLWQLFLDSRSPRARDANPQGPEAYDKAFAIIESGYAALRCREIVGR
jgi:hypothetical protein